MPDLGKYETVVLASYAVAGVLIAALVAASLLRAAKVRKALAAAEARLGGRHG